MRLLHEIAIFQTVKSKVIISLFEIVRLSVSISLRNLYNSLKSIKEMYFSIINLQRKTTFVTSSLLPWTMKSVVKLALLESVPLGANSFL